MKSKFLRLLLLLPAILAFSTMKAQTSSNGNDVLFTVNGEPVTRDEFLYVYKKNNPGKENDFSQKSLQDYLTLYENFKLKVTEARAEKIDTVEKVREELEKYGDQLIKSNFDKAMLDPAVQVEYNRMLKERLVYHIMYTLPPGAAPADTLVAWNKMNDALMRLKKGEDFGKVAQDVSSDVYSKDQGGMVGWVTAFTIPDMVFENTVYNTKVGSTSQIVRTSYGNHIIKVGLERPASGTIHVEHLLIKVPKNATPAQIAAAKSKIDSIYGLIQKGASFEDMVKRFSDDNTTAQNNGTLDWFGLGKMEYAFQEAAFGLKKDGDVSQPVETSIGWHLIKRLQQKPIDSLSTLSDEIKGKIERSPQYNMMRDEYVAKVKKKYPFTEFPAAKAELMSRLDSSFLKNTWKMSDAAGLDKPLFTIGTKSYTQQDMASHIELNQRAYRDRDVETKFDKIYQNAEESTLIEYDLSQTNIDFKRLMEEYRDGIPLFALLEEKVWSMASKDSVGLEQYYEQHKSEYMWDQRVDATIYKCQNEDVAKDVKKMIDKGTSDKDILAKYNKDTLQVVTIQNGLFLPGQDSNVDKLNQKTGVGDDILASDGTITFVSVNKIVPPAPKTLQEARGYVISNYQDYLEQKWIDELKQKYPIVLNQKVFDSMVK